MNDEELEIHMRNVANHRFKNLSLLGEDANGMTVEINAPPARNDNILAKTGFENDVVRDSINRMLMQEFSSNLGVDELDVRIDTAIKLINKKIEFSIKQVSDIIANFEKKLAIELEKINKKID